MRKVSYLHHATLLFALSISIRKCNSFSASLLNPKPFSASLISTKPSIVLNTKPSIPVVSDAWEKYLQIHQSVRKRRSFRRLFEIAQIMSGQVLRPLVWGFLQEPLLIRSSDDWDTFWNKTTSFHRGSLSNAQRVAQGFQQLGPTFVKLGQALATRPDIVHVPLAEALADLQDRMLPFDNLTAKGIIRRDLKDKMPREELQAFLQSLPDKPIAAASVAQVYKGHLPGYGNVAVKVQRPGIRLKAERDATLFHSVATWLQCLKEVPLLGDVSVQTLDEFTARVLEDMDFAREAKNMQRFSELYCNKRGSSSSVQVVVPELLPELSTDRVIVMEWLEGTKLTETCHGCVDPEKDLEENLALVTKAIECTLSQLLDTGLLHADPHTGNLLKVRNPDGTVELGYLDFGLVSTVPQRVRDGIVCAVVQLVFARNFDAVADLCADLELIPEDRVKDPEKRQEFLDALREVFDDIMIWPKDERGRSTAVPKVRFEKLVDSYTGLITRFDFSVPPYFLNNARALATLEGIALKLDPDFNILRVIYPYSINHLMRNPSVSKKTEETFMDICRSPTTRLVDPNRFMILLNDWALLTGYRKRKIFFDLATSAGGRRVSARMIRESYLKRARRVQSWGHNIAQTTNQWYSKCLRRMSGNKLPDHA